jgi:hypothetical protein
MNFGFEAKRVFHNKTGLGNYSRDLVRILSNYFPGNNYFLYNPKKNKKTFFVLKNTNVFERNPISKFNQKFKNYWRQNSVVKDLVKDEIVLYHGLSGELPSGLSKKGIKSIVTIHDLIFVRYPKLYSFFDRKIHFYKFKNEKNQESKKQYKTAICFAKQFLTDQSNNELKFYFLVDQMTNSTLVTRCAAPFSVYSSE